MAAYIAPVMLISATPAGAPAGAMTFTRILVPISLLVSTTRF
jgi:hypothetical protein